MRSSADRCVSRAAVRRNYPGGSWSAKCCQQLWRPRVSFAILGEPLAYVGCDAVIQAPVTARAVRSRRLPRRKTTPRAGVDRDWISCRSTLARRSYCRKKEHVVEFELNIHSDTYAALDEEALRADLEGLLEAHGVAPGKVVLTVMPTY